MKEALGRRLDRLSGEANELLKLAAVAGREFSYETLSLVAEHDDETLLRLLEEGLGARVIEEAQQAGRFRFTHALMQETLLEEISTTRRVRLHGPIGEAIEQRYGDRAREQAARLAGHFVESAALNRDHAARAVRYSGLAVEEALDRLAWPEAAAHFEHALELLETAGGLPPLDEAALHEGLGRALVAMGGREADGFREAALAFRVYADAADTGAAFRVAAALGPAGIGGHRYEGMLAEAISLQPEGNPERGFLECELAFRRGLRGEHGESLRRLDVAFAIADRTGNRHLELRALEARATTDDFNGRPGLDDHVRAAALADELGDAPVAARAHPMAALSHLTHTLDLGAALRHAEAGRRAAEKTGLSAQILTAAYLESLVHLNLGEVSNREALERALELSPLDPRIVCTRFCFALVSGNNEEAEASLETFDHLDRELRGSLRSTSSFLVWGSCSYAAWWWATGLASARDMATRLCEEERRSRCGRWGTIGCFSRPGLVTIASGDAARIAAWHDEPETGESWRYSGLPPLQVVRGLAAEKLGRPAEALAHHNEAFDVYRPSLWLWPIAALERARLLVGDWNSGGRKRRR
ncbi:MAG: hypothetical protein IPH65_16150 [Dehalococcoidia bacterium]|uniref:hypothetical protein n=1 Tax=Candidatus Amarobacter glycogenicus TaxID=3140699 RepID=UPI003135F106|nr:hypothetical protein [Dehalococcoidia bacterium]